ncbi:MAG: hypothetical protein PHS53_01350 [Candidatus Pacebacteria bacterium]|nr:hypothetical protein [Candidatus Paceibacterota bacterium]MDD5356779.1 hypothetical protein [Candidatus Paceibacterota bacterium]
METRWKKWIVRVMWMYCLVCVVVLLMREGRSRPVSKSSHSPVSASKGALILIGPSPRIIGWCRIKEDSFLSSRKPGALQECSFFFPAQKPGEEDTLRNAYVPEYPVLRKLNDETFGLIYESPSESGSEMEYWIMTPGPPEENVRSVPETLVVHGIETDFARGLFFYKEIRYGSSHALAPIFH